MYRYSVFFLFGLLLLPLNAEAQDAAMKCPACPECKVCEEDEEKDPSLWEKSLSFGFGLTDGNSNTTTFHGKGKLFRDYESNIWNFEVGGSYGEADSGPGTTKEQNKGDLTALAEYKRLLTDMLYAGIGVDFLHDDIAEVKHRVTISPHIGYFLIRNDQMRLSIEVGPSYVDEEVDDVSDDYIAFRAGERFEWDLSETAKFFQTAEYIHDFDESDNYIVNAEVGVEAAMTSMLSLVLSVQNAYDNIPAAGLERNDTTVTSALQVNF